MTEILDIRDEEILTVLQEVSPQFKNSLKQLKLYKNTIISNKDFETWVSELRQLLINTGNLKPKEECCERLREFISNQVGFSILFRKTETKEYYDHNYWKLKKPIESIILEKKRFNVV